MAPFSVQPGDEGPLLEYNFVSDFYNFLEMRVLTVVSIYLIK